MNLIYTAPLLFPAQIKRKYLSGNSNDNNLSVLSCKSRASSIPLQPNRRHLGAQEKLETLSTFERQQSLRKEQQSSCTGPDITVQKAPLLWEAITDAETGEPLELTTKQWVFPSQRQASTNVPFIAGCIPRPGGAPNNDNLPSVAWPGPWDSEEKENNLLLGSDAVEEQHLLTRGAGVDPTKAALFCVALPTEDADAFCGVSSITQSTEQSFSGKVIIPTAMPSCAQSDATVYHAIAGVSANVSSGQPTAPIFAQQEQEPLTPRPTDRRRSPFRVLPPQKQPFVGLSAVRPMQVAVPSPGKNASNGDRCGSRDDRNCSGLSPPSAVKESACRRQRQTTPPFRPSTQPAVTDPQQEEPLKSQPVLQIPSETIARKNHFAPHKDDASGKAIASVGVATNSSSRTTVSAAVSENAQSSTEDIQETRDRYLRYVRF